MRYVQQSALRAGVIMATISAMECKGLVFRAGREHGIVTAYTFFSQ